MASRREKTVVFLMLAILAAVFAMALPTSSYAQEKVPAPGAAAETDEAKPEGVKTREWVGADAKKVVEITFDETAADKIYGKVQKPGVDYLISQGDTGYLSIPLDRNIVEELKSSLGGNPF